jgi:ATP-binding cassette subfamily B (MDR/TAP) protein 1
LVSGVIFGISYLILFVAYGLIFYISAIFIRDNNLTITNSFSAVFLVLFSGMIAGNNVKNIPDLSLLKTTADRFFALIDLESEDQIQVRMGSKLISKEIKGNISFRNVNFQYESRT